MPGPVRDKSLQEPLDDEERELMDSDGWDWEHPIEGATVHEPTVTLRVTRDEYLALFLRAEPHQISVQEYLQRVTLKLARRGPRGKSGNQRAE
jgi:hypothetical protein